jgi:atypical dual specificity phosphatase
MIHRFYWLVDGAVAGCSRPGETEQGRGRVHSGSPSSDQHTDISHDLSWLRQQGIGALLSLTEEPLPDVVLADHDLDTLHLAVPDLSPPIPEQFMLALDFIDRHRSQATPVAVHCLQGQGRTGVVLAALLIRDGDGADAAITHLRAICPGAVGTPEQERALHRFAARRDWIL